MELVKLVYGLTNELPINEKYNLISQINRAVVSVLSNLSEGNERGDKEFLRFIDISMGSLSEVDTQLKICVMLNYLDESDMIEFNQIKLSIRKMVTNLRKYLNSKIHTPKSKINEGDFK